MLRTAAVNPFNEQEVISRANGFVLSQWTDSAVSPFYQALKNIDGTYIITKTNTTAFTIQYFKNKGNYSTDWTNRASLTYADYDIAMNG